MRSKRKVPKDGYALVSIVVIGLFAIVSMLAMTSYITSVFRSESVQKQKDSLVEACDSALDNLVDKINRNEVFPGKSVLNSTELGLSDSLTSVNYDTTKVIAPAEQIKISQFSVLNPMISTYKIIEITATRGAFSKSLRVLLEPRSNISPPGAGESAISARETSLTPLFKQPLLANSTLTFDNPSQLTIKSSSSNDSITIQSNSTMTLNSNLDLTANLKIGNDSGEELPSNSSLQVKGDIDVNGDQLSAGLTSTGSTNTNSSFDTSGSLAAPLSDSSTIALPQQTGGSTKVSLNSGSYQFQGISASAPGFEVPASSTSPVKIYLDNSSDLNLQSSQWSNLTSSPSNLQIFYSGINPVKLTMSGDFNGIIYSPNAPLTIDGNGNFSGGLVGRDVKVSMSGNLTLSSTLNDASSSVNQSNGLVGAVFDSGSQKGKQFYFYQPVTWQELSTSIVK